MPATTLLLQLVHLKMKPLRRQQRHRLGGQMSPGLVSAVGDCGIQVKEKLVRKAVDRRGLPESQPQSNGFFQAYAVRRDRLLGQQRNEAAAARVRPQIRMEQFT